MKIQCPFCGFSCSSLKFHLLTCRKVFLVCNPHRPKLYPSEYRIQTFNCWTHSQNLVYRLVENGFYFTGSQDRVTCFWCNVSIKDWNLYDDPLERHVNTHPGCLFARNLYTKLAVCFVCHLLVPRGFEEHNRCCPVQLQNFFHVRDAPGKFPRNPKMKYSFRRFLSFRNKWPESVIKALVDSGFYYTGNKDTVICFCCDGFFTYPPQEPLKKHLEIFPKCEYAQWKQKLYAQVTTINYEAMKFEMNRLNTFQTWSAKDNVNPTQMAEIGFFNLQFSDMVQCAFCKVILGPWIKNYDPLKTHLLRSPDCYFMKGISHSGNVPMESKLLKPLHPKMMNLMRRLSTFVNWLEKEVSTFTLAKGGFYCKRDLTLKCFWCGLEVKVYSPDVLKLHIKSQPNCLFASHTFKEKSILPDTMNCKICLDHESEMLFTPCHHLSCCIVCAQELECCCICRQPIQEKIRVFMS